VAFCIRLIQYLLLKFHKLLFFITEMKFEKRKKKKSLQLNQFSIPQCFKTMFVFNV